VTVLTRGIGEHRKVLRKTDPERVEFDLRKERKVRTQRDVKRHRCDFSRKDTYQNIFDLTGYKREKFWAKIKRIVTTTRVSITIQWPDKYDGK
jgi:hypothetical protein